MIDGSRTPPSVIWTAFSRTGEPAFSNSPFGQWNQRLNQFRKDSSRLIWTAVIPDTYWAKTPTILLASGVGSEAVHQWQLCAGGFDHRRRLPCNGDCAECLKPGCA